MENKELPSNYLKEKMMVPNADPPRDEDVNLLYQFFERRYYWCRLRSWDDTRTFFQKNII